MPDRIDRKVRNASFLFFTVLVVCIFVVGLGIERLVAGDSTVAIGLFVVGLGGFAWAVLQRYGSNGLYNPSRIHRREKAR